MPVRGQGRGGRGASDEEGVDGRILRSRRSRERILEALVELIAEGDMQPTGERVAARAACGLRTVYRHFEDMDGLYREVQAHVKKLVEPVVAEPARAVSLEERIAAVVQMRSAIFERAAPFLRSGAATRWRSKFLSQSHAEMVRDLRSDLRRVLPEAEAHMEIAELLTSFEAWDRLRVDQKLSRDKAQGVIEAGLRVLVAGRGANRRRRKA